MTMITEYLSVTDRKRHQKRPKMPFLRVLRFKHGATLLSSIGLNTDGWYLMLLFHLKDHCSKDVNLKSQLKWSSHFGVRSSFVYCSSLSYWVSLIMVTITRHIFIDIFSKWNNFQPWNLSWVMRKIWAFLWNQNLEKLAKYFKNWTGLL